VPLFTVQPNVRITSDGTPEGTEFEVRSESGEWTRVNASMSLNLTADPHGATATIVIANPILSIATTATIETTVTPKG
jgi:hypothetical protein